MIGQLVYLFYDPQYGRCHRHRTPISIPLHSSDQPQLRPNFARTLMSSEVTPRYLPPSLDYSLTTVPRGARSLDRLAIIPTGVIVGRAFHAYGRTPSLFCELEGGR